MKKYNETKNVYLTDLLAYMFEKWKLILIVTALFTVLFGGSAALMKVMNKPVSSADIDAARSQLKETEIAPVTELFNAYKAHQEAVDKLSGYQKDYYEILVKAEEGKNAEPTPSIPRSLVSGIIIGLFAAAAWLTGEYTVRNTIKTGNELSDAGVCVFGKVSVDKKKKDVLSGAVKKLRHTSTDSIDSQIEKIASDISVTAAKKGMKSLYLMMISDDENENQIAESICRKLSGMELFAGNPVRSGDDLKQLAIADGALLFTVLKKTRNEDISACLDTCDRYGVNLLGAVSVDVF